MAELYWCLSGKASHARTISRACTEVSSHINYLEDIVKVKEMNSLTDAKEKLADVKEMVGEKDKVCYFRGKVKKHQNKKQITIDHSCIKYSYSYMFRPYGVINRLTFRTC